MGFRFERDRMIQELKELNIHRSDNTWCIQKRLDDMGVPRKNYIIADGASKICLVFKDKPFVIKWSYNKEEAMQEVENYQKAIAENLEMFFPQTAHLCTFNDVDFVVQEKIDYSVNDLMRDMSPDILRTRGRLEKISKTAKDRIAAKMEKEFRKAGDGYHRDLDRIWAKVACSLYGKNVCKRLCNFVVENGINDLHSNNIGYKGNRPIILDFSGYQESYSSEENSFWS